MSYLKFTIGIFIILAASRLIPHPPNFTSLIALSFLCSFNFLENLYSSIFTKFCYYRCYNWVSQHIIFYVGKCCFNWYILKIYISADLKFRLIGVISACFVFFIISNFGVWLSGNYGYSFSGLLECYFLAIPFLVILNMTIFYTFLIEIIYFIYKKKFNRK